MQIGISISPTQSAGKAAASIPVTYLSFDGSGDYVQIASGVVTAYPFTLAVRLKDISAIGQLTELSFASQTDVYYTTLNRADPAITRLTARNTTAQNTDETGTNTNDGNWHTVVAVFENATTRTLYVDSKTGIADNTTSVLFNGGVSHFTVGSTFRSSTIANTITGKLRDVRIYSRALSSSEASVFYSEGTVSSSNLELWWKLDEGTGTTATDSSGNGRNGSITGATWGSE